MVRVLGIAQVGLSSSAARVSAAEPAAAGDADGARAVAAPAMKPADDRMQPPAPGVDQLTGKAGRSPSRVDRVDRPGARAEIDLKDWSPAELKQAFLADIRRGFELLKRLPPAITFFGGARIRPEDPFYDLSREIGRRLAEAGIPPRTGAGPGIMTAVPEGYKAGLVAVPANARVHFHPVVAGFSAYADANDHRTQGFNIVLPHEQKLSPAIDVHEELTLFPFRKLALYENVRGIVTFPGGFGTLDELFEVWSLAARGLHSDPLAAVGVAFWGPIFDAIERVAVRERPLIDRVVWDKMVLTDDPDALMDHLAGAHGVRGFEGEPDQLAASMAAEIADAVDLLDRLPEAVTVIGGRNLSATDPTCASAAEAAASLTRAGIPLRVGGAGEVAEAVVAGARSADPDAVVQGLTIEGEDPDRTIAGLDVKMSVRHPITHKELIGRRSRALVVLPGAIGTLDELFTVLCQVQTGKLPRIPIVLVGKDYWQPIFDAIRQQMLAGDRKTIAAADLDLVTVVDDSAAILAALA